MFNFFVGSTVGVLVGGFLVIFCYEGLLANERRLTAWYQQKYRDITAEVQTLRKKL